MSGGVFIQFAETAGNAEASSTGVLDALGIDWQMLVFQMVGFLILVWLLGKYVYPVLIKQVDERQAKIDASLQAAREAEDHADAAQERIDAQLDKARKEAKGIVNTAKDEAAAMLTKADEKSKANAEHLLETARTEINNDVIAAKKALHNETIELVAQATEKVVGTKHLKKIDKAFIADAIEEASS